MRRQAARLARRSFLVAALLAGCATTQPPGPARLSVHIDTLDPALFQHFVDARLKWLAYIRPRGATDLRGTYLQVGDHTLYSVFYFRKWADLTQHSAEADRRLKKIPDSVGKEYDSADSALVFPHHSEFWIERPELEFGSPSATALVDANVAELVIESVKPTLQDQYWDTWPKIKAALEQARYPLQRVTYSAQYGSGRMMSFWLAPSEAVLKATPPLAQALTVAVGEARAAELLKAWRDCVVATETQPVTVRHDMASPP